MCPRHFFLLSNQISCFQGFIQIIRGKSLVPLYISLGEDQEAEENIPQYTINV